MHLMLLIRGARAGGARRQVAALAQTSLSPPPAVACSRLWPPSHPCYHPGLSAWSSLRKSTPIRGLAE